MKWLFTAFEPFDQAQSNSSLIMLKELSGLDWQEKIDFHFPVPVKFASAFEDVEKKLKSGNYQGVLALGQAEGRKKISLERVALNWIDARIQDNAGYTPPVGKILSGPDMYWCNIPWEDFAMPNEKSEDWERSYSAGTFVCNYLMYKLLHLAQSQKLQAGFLHIPVLQSQSDIQFKDVVRIKDDEALNVLKHVARFLVKP